MAYPHLQLPTSHKIKVLQRMLASEFSLDTSYTNRQLYVDNDKRNYIIVIDIDDETSQYQKSIAIDNFMNYISAKKSSKFLRWIKGLLPKKKTKNIFMIRDKNTLPIMFWLQTTVNPKNYQIYSKFDTDISISFKNDEEATLFKLTFGN